MLASNPEILLSAFNGAASVLHVPSVSIYHINPLGQVSGISGDDPGRALIEYGTGTKKHWIIRPCRPGENIRRTGIGL